MSEDSVQTIRATFATREGADRAIEHLVQQAGVDRSDVFVEASGKRNSAGTSRSGGDAARTQMEGSSFKPKLDGVVVVTADVTRSESSRANTIFREQGAQHVEIE